MGRSAIIACLTLFGACSPQLVDAIDGPDLGPTSGSAGQGTAGQAGAEAGGATNGGAGGSDSGAAGQAGAGGQSQEPPLRSDALLHRYSFNGTGVAAVDQKGGAHGTVVGTELGDTGSLALAGLDTEQYVDLPDGLVSGLGDATFEAWVTWEGGAAWQRIFDFGNDYTNADGWHYGDTYLFLTALGYEDRMRVVISSGGGIANEVFVEGASTLAIGEPTHLAVVLDDQNDTLSLYRDGALEGSATTAQKLSEIQDINNYFGKSQYQSDAEFAGTLHEIRIYDAALSAEDIAASFAAGPDAVFPLP